MVIVNFGFRYHLASLMAVFFSLVLGILIGGALYQDSALVEEQGLLIADMEMRFIAAQDNLNRLQTKLNQAESAWLELRDAVLPGRLASKTVVIVADLDRNRQELTRLETLFRFAGAQPKRIKSNELGSYNPQEGESLIFCLVSGQGSYPTKELKQLEEKGASLVFVKGMGDLALPADLPRGLRVDGIDTVLGEIALVLGLSSGSEGNFGLREMAKVLFP